MNYPKPELPEDVPRLFAEAWNRRDAEAIAGLFEEKAEFVNVTGLWWHNRGDIKKAHAYGLSTIFKDSSLKVIRTKVNKVSEGVAVVLAKMRLSGQTAIHKVKQAGERRTIFTFVLQRKAGIWRCVSAQNTDIVDNMETHIRDEDGNLKAVDYRQSENS